MMCTTFCRWFLRPAAPIRLTTVIHSIKAASILCSGALAIFALNAGDSIAGVRTVFLSGQHAPGTPDGTVYAYSNNPPAVNDLGQTAFLAHLTDGALTNLEDGIWSEASGALHGVARERNQAPPASMDLQFFNLGPPTLNGAGQSAFYAIAKQNLGDASYSGVWREDAGNLELVAVGGSHAPGTPNGVNFSSGGLINGLVLLNAAGHTAFKFFVSGDAVASTNDIGIWSTSTGSLDLVARKGNQAPDAPLGVTFNSLGDPVLNDSGAVAFAASMTGSGTQFGFDGIWSGMPGNVHLKVRDGNDAPGTPPGVKFLTFAEPALNDSGRSAFLAILAGAGVDSTNDVGIWSEGAGNLELLAREGSHAPGAGGDVTFSGFNYPVLDVAGRTAFAASLSGSGVDVSNDAGIWAGTSADFKLLIRGGTQAPGTPSGAKFDEFSTPVLNAIGQFAFIGQLSQPIVARDGTVIGGGGGVDSTNARGIWATNVHGALTLVAREGDLLEVGPGDFRRISSFHFAVGTGIGDGRQSGFNDRGQVAFAAFFSDGSSGVFVSDIVAVPEPDAFTLSTLLSLVIVAAQRKMLTARAGCATRRPA